MSPQRPYAARLYAGFFLLKNISENFIFDVAITLKIWDSLITG